MDKEQPEDLSALMSGLFGTSTEAQSAGGHVIEWTPVLPEPTEKEIRWSERYLRFLERNRKSRKGQP